MKRPAAYEKVNLTEVKNARLQKRRGEIVTVQRTVGGRMRRIIKEQHAELDDRGEAASRGVFMVGAQLPPMSMDGQAIANNTGRGKQEHGHLRAHGCGARAMSNEAGG